MAFLAPEAAAVGESVVGGSAAGASDAAATKAIPRGATSSRFYGSPSASSRVGAPAKSSYKPAAAKKSPAARTSPAKNSPAKKTGADQGSKAQDANARNTRKEFIDQQQRRGRSNQGASRGGGRGRSSGLFPGGAPKGFKITGEGGSAHKLVIAEFIAAVVLVGLTPILMRQPNNGHVYVPDDFVRLTAVCLVFFVLALLANTPKASRVAAAFGALVLLGISYNAAGSLQVISDIFVNAISKKGTESAGTAGTASINTATYAPLSDLSQAPTGAPNSNTSSTASGSPATGSVLA